MSGLATIPLMGNVSRGQPTDWPSQPVRFVTPSAPGSSTDFAARAFAQHLSARWKKPVVVEAKTGAQGAIAVKALLERSGDQHTLLFSPTGIVTVTPLMTKTRLFDPAALSPISLAAIDYLTIAASVDSSVSDLAELIDVARRNPNKLNVAAGLGGPSLALASFLKRHKLDVAHVPYRSPPDAISDLVAGRIQVLVGPLAPVLPLAREGKVRLLAVTNSERTQIASDVRTASEQGFSELTFEGSLGIFGPAELSATIQREISEGIALAARDPDIVGSFQRVGLFPRAESGKELADRLASQTLHWQKVIQETEFKAPG